MSPRNFAERETKWDPNLTVKVGQADELFKPYDHQLAAWDKLEKYFHHDNKPAGILVVPTGGGKTAIAARWLLQHHIAKGGRVLWFAHRRSLLRQAFGTFVGAAYLAAPKKQIKLVAISAEDCGWSSVAKEHDVVFSSVQSAMQEGNFGFLDLMGQQSPGGLMVVIDEAHHAAAPGYRRVLTELQKRRAPLLGLTATPIRMDEADDKRLWNLFGGIVYEIDKKTLFNKGILATPHLETVATHVEFERDFTPADYAHLSRFGELGPRVLTRLAKHSGRNRLIVEYYVKNQEIYGQTIVFAVDTLHAQTLVDEFKKAGVDADYVDYTRKDSHAVMSAFRDKAKPKVLVNVEMLTEGFDAPKTRTVFLARPTKSEALLSQMIGRALRGPLAGGNAEAYLVTFLDTWSQFDVFDMEYVVSPFQAVAEETTPSRLPAKLVIISADLIREAYRLVQSNVRGSFEGIHQCLAYGWYIWEEEFDDDVQRRLVLVFENQRAGYEAFDAEYSDTSKIPAEVSEDLARDLVQRFFSNCPDPPPRWSDLQSILNGRRKDCQVVFYTFEEKKAFDPALLATRFFQEDLGPQKQDAQLRTLWDANDACKLVYRSDFKAFVEDVGRELTNLREDGTRDPIPPEIVRSVPKGHARRWPEGQPGVSLTVLKDAVLAQPRHFPDGPPVLKDLRFAAKPMTNVWGFFQFNDKAIVINPELNSPDIPRYVMEFLLYHELLHAHMPSAGHNRDFRDRERRFIPSPEAVAEAKRDGHVPGTSKDAWRVIADQFLDTFAEHFAGTHVGM